VRTLTTIARFVSSSSAMIGMRLAFDLIIFRHASYSGLEGCMETVSIGATPIAFSISVLLQLLCFLLFPEVGRTSQAV